METEFEEFLHGIEPSPQLFELACVAFKEHWDRKVKQMSGGADAAKAEIDKLSRKASMLVDKIVETDDLSMVSVYEQHLKAISTEKVLLVEKSKKQLPSKRHFEEMYRTALYFLASPRKLWESDCLEYKKMVLKLVFPERVKYCQR